MVVLGSLLGLSLIGYGALAWGPHLGLHITRFLMLHGALSLGCAAAWWVMRNQGGRSRWALIWIGAVVFRALLVGRAPELSDDLYRYIWDGGITLQGINPFRHPPDAAALEAFRQPWFELINNRHLPTIYPPLLQGVFAGLAWISPTVSFFKGAFAGFDLLAGVFLFLALRAAGRESWTVLYLWNPAVINEFAGQGHSDAVGLCFLSLALWRHARGSALEEGLALCAASLVKFFPVVVLPLLMRRLGWRWMLLPAVLVAAYAPFAWHGVNPLGSLGTFASEWKANAFGFLLLERLPESWPRPLLGVFLGIAGLAAWKRQWPWPVAYSWLVGGLLLLSPVVHPWYVLWLLPAALWARHPAWVAWVFLAPLVYLVMPGYLTRGIWKEGIGPKLAQYLPVLSLVLWQRQRRTRRL